MKVLTECRGEAQHHVFLPAIQKWQLGFSFWVFLFLFVHNLPQLCMLTVNFSMRGAFTGRRLADCFSPGRADWIGARRIINGMDRAERVAGYGREFFTALGG